MVLRKLLHGERLGLRRFLHSFFLFVRHREITAVDHVELVLRDAFFLQLAVRFFGVLGNVGVLLLQRRDAVFAETERGGWRRRLGWGQRLRFKFPRSGRRRVAHVLEGGDHGTLVDLDHLHHLGAGVLGFLVALEVVYVFDFARHVCP